MEKHFVMMTQPFSCSSCLSLSVEADWPKLLQKITHLVTMYSNHTAVTYVLFYPFKAVSAFAAPCWKNQGKVLLKFITA